MKKRRTGGREREECLCTDRELYIFAASSSDETSVSLILPRFSFLLPSYFLFLTIHFQFNINAFARFCHAFVRFSLSSVFAFSCRYRYYLKPHRVSTVLEMRDAIGIENANDSFLYTKASVSFIIRLWTTWRVSWICRYCTIRKSNTAKMT